MGKASKWLKALLGFKKSDTAPPNKRWSFAKSHDKKNRQKSPDSVTPGTYNAMTAVVKLSSRTNVGYGRREERAAVIIQSHFRAYLSRRALKALRALVKVQALIRGQIMRNTMEFAGTTGLSISSSPGRAMQHHTTLARSSTKQHQQLLMLKQRNSSTSNTNDQGKPHLISHTFTTEPKEISQRQGSDDPRSDNILQVHTWKPKHKHKQLFHSPHLSHSSDQYCLTFSTPTHQASASIDLDVNANFSTAENSPLYYSASSTGGSSKRAPVSRLSCHSNYPSYMAYTQSSKAKVRSLSAPKQRTQHEKSSPVNRYSVHGYGDPRLKNPRAYPGSSRLDRKGMPVSGDISGFGVGNWQRYW